MNTQEATCPHCHNHCPVSDPKCDQGREYAEDIKKGLAEPTYQNREAGSHHGHRQDHHGHRKSDLSTVTGLLQACGHAMFHGELEEATVRKALTPEEQEILKELLKRTLNAKDKELLAII